MEMFKRTSIIASEIGNDGKQKVQVSWVAYQYFVFRRASFLFYYIMIAYQVILSPLETTVQSTDTRWYRFGGENVDLKYELACSIVSLPFQPIWKLRPSSILFVLGKDRCSNLAQQSIECRHRHRMLQSLDVKPQESLNYQS